MALCDPYIHGDFDYLVSEQYRYKCNVDNVGYNLIYGDVLLNSLTFYIATEMAVDMGSSYHGMGIVKKQRHASQLNSGDKI